MWSIFFCWVLYLNLWCSDNKFNLTNIMFFNFAPTILIIFVLSVLCELTWIFTSIKLNYTNFFDVSSRVYIDDFVFNTYYYYWTTFWYIPTLVAIYFISCYLVVYSFSGWLFSCFVFFFITIFTYDSLSYWSGNLISSDVSILANNINTLLLNNLNNYHPFFFYTCINIWFIRITLFSSFLNLRYSCWFNINYFSQFSFCQLNLFLYFSTTMLFFGSWWAFQEGSWGGWWNWDPSEVFGMLLIFSSFIILHNNNLSINFYSTSKLVYLVVLFLWVTYLVTQVNFSLISHNFDITTNSITFDSVILILISFYVTLIFFHLWLFRNWRVFANYNLFFNSILLIFSDNTNLYSLVLLIIIILLFYWISFLDLINNYVFQLVGISNQSDVAIHVDLLTYLLMVFMFSFWYVSSFLILIIVWVEALNVWHYFIFSCIISVYRSLYIYHQIFYLFIWLNFIVFWNYLNFSLVNTLFSSFEVFGNYKRWFYYSYSTSCNSLECSHIYNTSEFVSISSSYVYVVNFLSETSLIHSLGSFFLMNQHFLWGGFFYDLFIQLVENVLVKLVLVILSLVLSFSYLVNSFNIIIF